MSIGQLKSLTILGSPKMEPHAFTGLKSVTSLTLGDLMTSIGKAFSYIGIESITIPDSVTSISDYAFYKAPNLKTAIIGNSVWFLGKGAFRGCTKLSSVTFGNSIANIETMAFDGCVAIGVWTVTRCSWTFIYRAHQHSTRTHTTLKRYTGIHASTTFSLPTV